MSAELLLSPDVAALEEALLDRIEEAKRRSPEAPLLVVAPSQAILWRIRRALLDAKRAHLNLHILHHQALAERILLSAGEEPPRVAGETLLLALLSGLLEREKGRLKDYATAFPGALSGLRGTLNDLREAGLRAEEATPLLRDAGHGEIAPLYAAYEKALDRLAAERGLCDRAGLVARAIAAAPRAQILAEAAGILHHGAYELVRIHADLLSACAKRAPLTILAPGSDEGAAFAYGRATLAAWPDAASAKRLPAPKGMSPLAARLDALYADGSGESSPVPPGTISALTAGSARAEIEAVGREILRRIAAGTPPREIGVVARTLEPYATHLPAVLGELGIPFVSSLSAPLLSHPEAEALRDLARALGGGNGGFGREPLLALFRSPVFRAAGILPRGAAAEPARWERLALAARVEEGADGWTDALPRWAEASDREAGESGHRDPENRLSAGTLASAVRALSRESARWERCRSWGDHAAFLRSLVETHLDLSGPGGDRLKGALEGCLAELARLDAVEAALERPRRTVGRDEAIAALERSLAEASRREGSSAEEGVRALDAMQARALPFRHLFLVGLTADQWPRKRRPDPFLPDRARRAIAEASGRRLPLHEETVEEDRQILATVLGAAGERLHLSLPRADDAGRERAHATLLRELARLAYGRADAARLLRDARLLPTDPASRIEQEADPARDPLATGLVTEREALEAAAARGGPAALAEAARALGADAALSAGIAYVEAANRWEPADLARDGASGAGIAEGRPLSPRQIETLGRCPLQYFFDYLLKAPRDESRGEEILLPWELGIAAHAVLEWIYGRLRAERLLPCQDAAAPLARARALLDEGFEARFPERFRAVQERLPRFWEAASAAWREAIGAFLAWDLARLARERGVPVATEREMERTVPLPTADGPREVRFKGRIDRIDRLEDGSLRVLDYKTSGRLDARASLTEMLKGRHPQLAIYWFLAEAAHPGERILPPAVLGVGPEAAQSGEEPIETMEEPDAEQRQALGDTLFTAVSLAREGLFPMRPGRHCDWCPYEAACRRRHPPTQARTESAPSFAPLAALERRSKSDPFGRKRAAEEEAP